MRNISVYPITLEEMAKAVERAYKEECEKARSEDYPIGGIHIAALKEAYEKLHGMIDSVS